MLCPKCTQPLPEDSEFCQYCGTILNTSIDLEPESDTEINSSFNIENDAETDAEHNATEDFPYSNGISAKSESLPEENTNSSVDNQEIIPTSPPPSPIEQVANTIQKKDKLPKQRFCKFCGGKIDVQNKLCTACGKRFFRIQLKHMLVAVSVLAICLGALNIVEFVSIRKQQELLSQKESTISSQQATISKQKSTIESLTDKADYFDTICSEMSRGNIGYAASNFKVDQSIIVVDKNETDKKFTLTANWSNGGTVSVDYSSYAATVDFDNSSWYTSTKMTVNPYYPGVTVVTFSNNVDSKTFKMVIIVTD